MAYITATAAEAAALRTHLANGASVQRAKASCGFNSRRARDRRLALARSREILRIVQAGTPKPQPVPTPVRLLTLSGRVVAVTSAMLGRRAAR